MKIFVVGASGRVASELIKDLVENGHQVTAASRHPESIVLADDPKVTAVKLDLHADIDEIAKVIGNQDAIYFTAGSRGKDLLQTDAFGAVKTMQVAQKNGIKRYVMLSSMHALEPKYWHLEGLAQIMNYNVAKFFADHYLVHDTDLDYTIVQPTVLTEEPGTGKVTFGDKLEESNPIPDVAKVLAEVLEYKNTIKKVIMMSSGNTAIKDALAKV